MASRRAWEPLSQVASGAAFGSNASLPLISCLALGSQCLHLWIGVIISFSFSLALGVGMQNEMKEWLKGFPGACTWEVAAVATGTEGTGFSGSDFCLQLFRRGQDSASLSSLLPSATRVEGPAGSTQGGTREIQSVEQGGLQTSASLALVLQMREPRPGR